jgi:hypothetical protein
MITSWEPRPRFTPEPDATGVFVSLVEDAEMFTQVRYRTNPYKLYISIEVVNSFVAATAYTTAIVYRVRSGHLNPLQLVLLGTMVEISRRRMP